MKQLLAAMVLVLTAACGVEVQDDSDFASRGDALTAVDLKLGVSGLNTISQGSTYEVTYVVTNLGQTFSAPVSVDFTLPAGASLLSSSLNRCSTLSATQVRCALPGMGLNRSYTSTATFALPNAGNSTFAVLASSASAETNMANNAANLMTIVVGPGPVVAPIPTTGVAVSYSVCSGNRTSFVECVPGTFSTRSMNLNANSTFGVGTNSLGTWNQNQAQTTLELHYNGTTLNAPAVSATCFQGLWTNDTTGVVTGAARACL